MLFQHKMTVGLLNETLKFIQITTNETGNGNIKTFMERNAPMEGYGLLKQMPPSCLKSTGFTCPETPATVANQNIKRKISAA